MGNLCSDKAVLTQRAELQSPHARMNAKRHRMQERKSHRGCDKVEHRAAAKLTNLEIQNIKRESSNSATLLRPRDPNAERAAQVLASAWQVLLPD